jgi:2-polyprenyl-6-methoxyphenol hydroxylase-like FAD-dependent oxidoreductase
VRGDGVRVLVVGAGIAGLAAARTLHDWGADVEVVDRLPAPPREGTGIYLLGNAVRALRRLGCAEEVAAHAVQIRRQETSDHRGRPLFTVDTDALWDGVGPCLALRRADLQQALLDALTAVPVRWGQGVEALSLDEAGASVSIGGGEERFDLVIGADGVHSTVRRLVLGPDAVRCVGQHARRFVVQADVPTGTWSVRLGRGTAILAIPIGGGRVYCYVDGPVDDPRSLRELLADYTDPVPALLDALDAALDAEGGAAVVQAGPIEEVVLDAWSCGAMLLIGDAAHASSPNMAQGAAMALEDAIVLPEALAAATTLGDGLAGFERRRRPRTDWVREQTHRRDRARSLPPAVRNVVLRRFGPRILRGNYGPLTRAP